MTVIAVSIISLVKIVIHVWGRWYATKISKQIQLNLRRRVFEHAVRLPLHRVQEIRSGGVASILREDGGSVGRVDVRHDVQSLASDHSVDRQPRDPGVGRLDAARRGASCCCRPCFLRIALGSTTFGLSFA